MKEIIKDYPNYEIHSHGEVYSLPRIVKIPNRTDRRVKGRFMSKSIGAKGYYYVTLTNEHGEKKFSIHQLVAMAFLGHIPNGNNIVVHHHDGNKLNNNVSNLRLISNGENVTLGWKEKGVTSKYRGVFYAKDRGYWRSFHAKKFYGKYSTELDAYNSVKHLH